MPVLLLPQLVTPTGAYALPLPDSTAGRLAVAVLESDASGLSRAPLAAAIRHDPALALWIVCRAGQLGSSDLRDVESLADWLAEHALSELTPGIATTAGSISQPAVPPFAERATSPWPPLLEASLGIANAAERIAAANGLDSGPAYLLGLLHLAPRWLAAAMQGPGQPQYTAALPHWLHAALCAIHAASEPRLQTAADCVARALEPQPSVPSAPGMPAACGNATLRENDRTADRAAVAKVKAQWLLDAEIDLLRPALARVEQLRKLENTFAETLEHEKLESLKELAQGAGHEINNPLANISARAQALLRDESDPDRRRSLAAINTQAFRAHEMIADLMLFARPPRPQFTQVDVAALLETVRRELAEQAAEQGTQLTLKTAVAHCEIEADRTQLAVAIKAICVNAIEALVQGGQVELELAPHGQGDESVEIAIRDNGPGIAAEVRRHLFDPFFSGREAGRGLGFGLAKAWRIVGLHGGKITVDPSPARGACLRLSLPAVQNR